MQRIREDAVRKAQEDAKSEAEAKAAQKRERSKFAVEATIKVNQSSLRAENRIANNG